MKEEPLTEKQRALAAENHNLIYAYAVKMGISIDEYYDVLSIGLCKAAREFDESKSKFATFAYSSMQNELFTHWRMAQKRSHIPENLVLSYDKEHADYQDSFLNSLQDFMSDEDMEYDIMLSEINDKLTDKEKLIVSNLINGFTQSEIAEKMGCKRQNVGYYIRRIRNKIRDCVTY